MSSHNKTAAIITAAGNSTRFNIAKKKEYAFLQEDKETVLSHTVDTFINANIFDPIIITIAPNDHEQAKKALSFSPFIVEEDFNKKIFLVEGKSCRQASIFEALKKLKALEENLEYVFIHDGARPWVDQSLLLDMYQLLQKKKAVVPVFPSTDTQKEIDSATGIIIRHLPRSSIFNVQTPQSFAFDPLFKAYLQAQNLESYTDDSEIFAEFGGTVFTMQGNTQNKKITFESDLA
ncbi:MAG: IspD/TarI family cytidylyltransferase [Treponemataceae bacterium]